MQTLESMLIKNEFIYETREELGTDVITEIFFVHPYLSDIWGAFPHVLLIDSTYKTNMYNMPFVQIVGMTPTGYSFCIVHAVICKERSDNFVWVLKRIKSMLDEGIFAGFTYNRIFVSTTRAPSQKKTGKNFCHYGEIV
ncbi:putative MULE transposase domain, FHY3/FAR1 family [Helianthus annuus]|nr:putative MULE transposase domain, FHY3/FAR1 family [Helianthus annuus]